MSRKLSDPEWLQFILDTKPTSMNLPPWGGVVQWGAQKILTFINEAGAVFATDITGDTLINWAAIPTTYDPNTGTAWYYLPQEIAATVAADAIAAGAIVRSTVDEVATIVGHAAGAVLTPTLSPFVFPIVIVGAAVLLMYLPKHQ